MINNQMLGVIDETTYKHSLQDLTAQRSLGAIPFAGRYRLIDFMLSNMVNADIRSVAIFPKYRYRSLMDHLGAGRNGICTEKGRPLFFRHRICMMSIMNSVHFASFLIILITFIEAHSNMPSSPTAILCATFNFNTC